MAELAQAARYNLPITRLNIPRVDFPTPPTLPVPQEEAIKARGELEGARIYASAEEKAAATRAQLIANIGNMLATLPEKVEASYWRGRENAVKRRGLDLQGQLLSGDLSGVSKLPPGATLRPDGSVSYTPQTEEDRLRLQILRQRAVPEVDQYDTMLQRWNAPFTPELSEVGAAPSLPATPTAGSYIDWIKGNEGLYLDAYNDSGRTSIGYGSKGEPGERITPEEADRRLLSELATHEARIDKLVSQYGVALTRTQKEALISFDFNTGDVNRIFETAAGNGQLDPVKATAKMAEWKHSDRSAKDNLLVGRRKKEIDWFNQPSEIVTQGPASAFPIDQPSLTPIGTQQPISFGASAFPATRAPLSIPPSTAATVIASAPPLADLPVRRPVGNLGRNPATGGFVTPISPTQAIETTKDQKQRLVSVPAKTETAESPTERALDRAIIARGKNPIGLTIEEKEQILTTSVPLRPSEKLSAIRDLRVGMETLPSKILLFGKGQMPGLDGIIERLDEIKKTAGEDFKKLSPQQGRTVVFQFSKFNDPNSAVLLGEYKAAADTLSIPDKIWQITNKALTGETVTPEQAKDIYDTVRAAHERAKMAYTEDAADILTEAKEMGISPQRLGIPSKAVKWTETPTIPTQQAPSTAVPPEQITTPQVKSSPKPGDIVGKFRFKGGNPADKGNWEPIP